MRLHEQFMAGLARTYHPLINLGNLHACQSPAIRSHTLVRSICTECAAVSTRCFACSDAPQLRMHCLLNASMLNVDLCFTPAVTMSPITSQPITSCKWSDITACVAGIRSRQLPGCGGRGR